MITSGGYYLDLDILTLDKWDKAKVGHFQFLRKPKVKSNVPWILAPIIKFIKWVFAGLNGAFGYRRGVLDGYVYERLHNAHIALFGQSETTQQWIDCKKKLIELRTERIITGNVFIENYIAIEKQRLEDIKKIKGMTTSQCLVQLAKFQSVGVIHKKDITVVEFENLMIEYVRATSKKE